MKEIFIHSCRSLSCNHHLFVISNQIKHTSFSKEILLKQTILLILQTIDSRQRTANKQLPIISSTYFTGIDMPSIHQVSINQTTILAYRRLQYSHPYLNTFRYNITYIYKESSITVNYKSSTIIAGIKELSLTEHFTSEK